MTIFAIVLNSPEESAWAKVRQTWDNHLVFDDRLAFISADGKTLTQDIADQIGMTAASKVSGVVIQMDYFAGLTSASVVEWVNKNRD